MILEVIQLKKRIKELEDKLVEAQDEITKLINERNMANRCKTLAEADLKICRKVLKATNEDV